MGICTLIFDETRAIRSFLINMQRIMHYHMQIRHVLHNVTRSKIAYIIEESIPVFKGLIYVVAELIELNLFDIQHIRALNTGISTLAIWMVYKITRILT